MFVLTVFPQLHLYLYKLLRNLKNNLSLLHIHPHIAHLFSCFTGELETEFNYGDVDSGNSTNHSPNEDKNISQATEGKTFFIALEPSFGSVTMLTSCQSQCLKIRQKVSFFNFSSTVSNRAILANFGAKIQILGRVYFWQMRHFWVIFKHCAVLFHVRLRWIPLPSKF